MTRKITIPKPPCPHKSQVNQFWIELRLKHHYNQQQKALWLLCMFNMSDITSMSWITAMFELLTYKDISYRMCRYVYCLHAKFHVSSHNSSLVSQPHCKQTFMHSCQVDNLYSVKTLPSQNIHIFLNAYLNIQHFRTKQSVPIVLFLSHKLQKASLLPSSFLWK